MKTVISKEEREKRRVISQRWLRHNKKGLLPAAIYFSIGMMLALVLPQELPDYMRVIITLVPALLGSYYYAQFLGRWDKAVDEEYKKEQAGKASVSPDIHKGR